MAVSRDKLAEALAYEQAKRQRLAEYIPTVAGPQSAPSQNLRTDLENFSAGLGQAGVNALEGVKGLITDPIGTAKGAYEAVRGIVRDPKVLAQALAETGRKAMSGPLGAGEVIGEMIGPMRGKPVMAELDVYHGSPHRFEEFDASKIGTGEGAQAYGHGVYLAEQPEVANRYRTAGAVVSASSRAQELANRAFDVADGNKTKALEWLQKRANDLPENQKELRQTYLDALNNYDSIRTQGNLYTADLPDEMVDRMLDWDKPLSKDAPQAVKDAFNKLAQTYPDLKEKLFAAYREGKPGSHYYSLLNDYAKTGDLVKNQSFASDAMRQAGIPGIKYLDAGSRGQGGSGTRNFVVFPGEEKKVKILERNGEKLANALKEQKPSPIQSYGVMGYPTDVLRREKQNFNSQYGLEEGKQFTKDYEVVNIDELRPTEKIEEKKVQSLMRTMREEGNSQDNPIPPIIVDSEGNILDGHNRYEAAKRIGAKQIPIIELYDYKTGSRFSE